MTAIVLYNHLCSRSTITDAEGNVEQKLIFDAWGNLRSPYTWTGPFEGKPMLDRGFTGHEHHYAFGLINMNGRMYDPVMSSFLSVDNYVQAPDFSQSFNRYAYCLNNPLKYTDPDGEIALTTLAMVGIGVATVMGGYTGYNIAVSKGYGFDDWQTYGYMLGGAAIGFAAGYTGAYLVAGGGFMANTAGIYASSLVNATGTTMLSGGSYTPPISFGFASFDPMTGEWGYLGKKGNSPWQNIGYAFGVLANVQDVVAGVNGGSYQFQYEKAKGNIGHANIRQVSYDAEGNAITSVKISVANKYSINAKNNLDWVWKSNFKKYTGGGELWLDVPEQGWERIPLQLNTRIVDWMYSNLEKGRGLWGITETRFGINYGCVSYAARALWTAGVPTIPIINYFGPSVLWTQLAIRQLGIQISPFLINDFGKKQNP